MISVENNPVQKMSKEKVLRQRAEKMAQPLFKPISKEGLSEVVLFTLAQESYAVEIKYLSEIFLPPNVTYLTDVPSHLVGLINVRRRCVAVMDLKPLFDLPKNDNSSSLKVMLLENEDREVGILIDTFCGAGMINLEKLQTTLSSLSGLKQELFKGVTEEGIILLDGSKIVSERLEIKE